MADICKLCEKNKTSCEEWSKSIHSMTEVQNERTKRVSLKEKQFQVANPASNEEVEKAEDAVFSKVDTTFSKGEYLAKDLKLKKDFYSFLEKHCYLRHYMLQIHKCDDANCCSPMKNRNGKLPARSCSLRR